MSLPCISLNSQCGLCLCMMIISYIFHFSYWSRDYWGKNTLDYSALVCENHEKTMIDDMAPRNKPQWHLQHRYEVTNNHNLWIEKQALKMTADKYNERDSWIVYFKVPILHEVNGFSHSLFSVISMTLKWYVAFLFCFVLFRSTLTEYHRVPGKNPKYDSCSHRTFREF